MLQKKHGNQKPVIKGLFLAVSVITIFLLPKLPGQDVLVAHSITPQGYDIVKSRPSDNLKVILLGTGVGPRIENSFAFNMVEYFHVILFSL